MNTIDRVQAISDKVRELEILFQEIKQVEAQNFLATISDTDIYLQLLIELEHNHRRIQDILSNTGRYIWDLSRLGATTAFNNNTVFLVITSPRNKEPVLELGLAVGTSIHPTEESARAYVQRMGSSKHRWRYLYRWERGKTPTLLECVKGK